MHFVRFEDCFEGLFFGTYSFLSRCYQLNGLLWPMGERDVHTHIRSGFFSTLAVMLGANLGQYCY